MIFACTGSGLITLLLNGACCSNSLERSGSDVSSHVLEQIWRAVNHGWPVPLKVRPWPHRRPAAAASKVPRRCGPHRKAAGTRATYRPSLHIARIPGVGWCHLSGNTHGPPYTVTRGGVGGWLGGPAGIKIHQNLENRLAGSTTRAPYPTLMGCQRASKPLFWRPNGRFWRPGGPGQPWATVHLPYGPGFVSFRSLTHELGLNWRLGCPFPSPSGGLERPTSRGPKYFLGKVHLSFQVLRHWCRWSKLSLTLHASRGDMHFLKIAF
eukprot:gene24399-biopygen16418